MAAADRAPGAGAGAEGGGRPARGRVLVVEDEAYVRESIERILRARGEAERFSAVLAEYTKAKQVTRTRLYLETLEEILPKMDKVILEEGQGGNLLPYLPIGRREGRP